MDVLIDAPGQTDFACRYPLPMESTFALCCALSFCFSSASTSALRMAAAILAAVTALKVGDISCATVGLPFFEDVFFRRANNTASGVL